MCLKIKKCSFLSEHNLFLVHYKVCYIMYKYVCAKINIIRLTFRHIVYCNTYQKLIHFMILNMFLTRGAVIFNPDEVSVFMLIT